MHKFLTRTIFCLGVLLLLASVSLQAVPIPYSVDDYIPVLFKDARLVVGGSMEFYGNGSSFENDSTGGSSYQTESSDYQYDNFSFNPSAYYQRTYTTVSEWYEYYADFDFNIRKSKNTNSTMRTGFSSLSTFKNESESKSTNVNPRIYQQIDLGKYVSGDFNVSARAYMSYSYNKTSNNENSNFSQSVDFVGTTATRSSQFNDSERPNDNKNLDLSGDLLFGHGRMYDGVFAFTAISMIEELDSKGLLLRTPTASEMEELTEIIYQNRLMHAIDYRIREIEIYDEINSYLNSKGIVDISNPMTTPVIRDVWEYFPTNSHPFGLMVRGGFGIMHSYSSSNETSKSTSRNLVETYDTGSPSNVTPVSDNTSRSHYEVDNKNTRAFPYFTVMVEKSKPINNRLQLNLAAQGWLYFSTKDTSFYEQRTYDGDSLTSTYSSSTSRDYESITRFNLYGQLSYVFDGRTSAYVSASYDRFDYDQTTTSLQENSSSSSFGDTLSIDRGSYSLNLNANFTYRISIPTTLSANVGYSKSTGSLFSSSIGHYSNDGYNFRIGIDHQIF